jgi:hypothetical protein
MRPLDDPDILQSAPDDVREERTAIILSRGGSVSTGGSNEIIMPSERNLLEEGSGLMAGADAVAEAASQLNYTGGTASQLFQLSANAAKRDEGRRRNVRRKIQRQRKRRMQLQPHISKQSKKPRKSWPTTTTRRAASQFLSSRHSANFTRRRETSKSQPRGTTYSQDFGSNNSQAPNTASASTHTSRA